MKISMKQMIIIIAIAIILLIICLGANIYRWKIEEERRKTLINYVYALSNIPFGEISDIGSTIKYLIDHNATDEILRYQISIYFHNTRILSYSSAMLQILTGDEKYRLFLLAMNNLKSFLITVKNKPNIREILRDNLDILSRIEEMFESISRIGNLTFDEAEKIFELSGKLKY